jgi:hypothetical protein
MECDDVSGATEEAAVDSTEDNKINETWCSFRRRRTDLLTVR